MSIKAFWDWLTTSRAFRLLEDQNNQLRADLTALREENKCLLLAVSPTLRAIEMPAPEPSAGAAPESPIKEKSPRRISHPAIASWRNSRQRLEFEAATQQRRLEHIMSGPGSQTGAPS